MERARMTPDEWQRSILLRRPSRLILNCTRQSGKSTVTAAMAVDELLRGPALVLAICPSERQSKLLIQATSKIYQCIAPLPQPQSTTHLMLANGSEMWALPSQEANIRGFAKVALIIIDEASRVSDALYNAVTPMLAVSGGRLALLSTPFGKRGFFHREWTEGQGWERVRITADQCPRLTKEFIAQERMRMPAAWFRQEYMCEFAEAEGAVFLHDDVAACFDSGMLEPMFPTSTAETDSELTALFS
jgi:hypothetical protein